MLPTELVLWLGLGILFSLGLYSSLREKQLRAATICAIGFIINSIFWGILIYYRHVEFVRTIGFIAILIVFLFSLVSVVRFFPPLKKEDRTHISQYDERDHMFSRNNLQFHPKLAEQYYRKNPELFEIDKAIQEKPELGHQGGQFYDKYLTGAAGAAFKVLSRTQHLVTGPKEERKDVDPVNIAEVIRQTAFRYGAADVGFVKLKKYHFYSHAGRQAENWGQQIKNDHKYAVVIIIAMDTAMIKQAPGTAVILESSRAYVEAAKVAHIIAEYIRGFGYDAKSHVDGKYEVICVPLAADAGLGEVGRIGLLMHPKFGPCVRISAVTTELELPVTKKKNYHIENFCRICRKCALNCPTGSISMKGKNSTRGFSHYSIKQERCYSFWKNVGTDCAVCLSVCPYTKPDTIFHKLARLYVSRNALNQRIGLFVDNLLYNQTEGKKYQFNPEMT